MSMNLSKPNWCSDEIFSNLANYRTILYDCYSFSESIRRINAGPTIEKFLTNIENNNAKKDGRRKIYLYSGHDLNVAAFTRAHNFSNIPNNPDFGSGIVVEKLRKKDQQIYLRVRMY